ncbi:MAG: hypothetical protein M5U33_07180 [Pseudorhodoplanes sp.]|nr:hypothetical protein [Pseudorhodoplanes sp.]
MQNGRAVARSGGDDELVVRGNCIQCRVGEEIRLKASVLRVLGGDVGAGLGREDAEQPPVAVCDVAAGIVALERAERCRLLQKRGGFRWALNREGEGLRYGPDQSLAVTLMLQRVGFQRRAGERARLGIERQPNRQRIAVLKRGGIDEGEPLSMSEKVSSANWTERIPR